MRRLAFIVIGANWIFMSFVDCRLHGPTHFQVQKKHPKLEDPRDCNGACDPEVLKALQKDESLYVAGDADKEISVIDSHDHVDKESIKNYTSTPGNNIYWLFTRNNPENPQILRFNDTKTLKKSNFDENKVVVFVVHGWRGNRISRINTLLTEAFLQNQDVNVIVFDWSAIASQNYVTARMGVPSIGKNLGKFISWLTSLGVKLEKMHLVGHSLGAHLVGNAGRYLKGDVKRITALDPAAPLWRSKDSEHLTPTDGQYVEVIHTNTRVLGYDYSLGHTDFYPNGGAVQPGCNTTPCSHSRAYDYMAATVVYNHLKAHKCHGMYSMRLNQCKGEVELMGNSELKKKAPGIYRVDTENEWPYNART